MRQPPDKQLILDSLAAIARGAGRSPSRSEFLSLSGISEHQVSQFFPNWNDAVSAAGLRPNTLNARLEDRELLEDWAFAVRRNRKIPARRTYRHLGQYDPRTFERRFGPWSKLPEVFRNFAQGQPEWADVLALLPAPAPNPARPKPVGARFSASRAPAKPAIKFTIAGPGNGLVRFSGNNLDARKNVPGALQNGGQRQRKIHHRAAHATSRAGSKLGEWYH